MDANRLRISSKTVTLIWIYICIIFSLACTALVGFHYRNYSEVQKKFTRENNKLWALERDSQHLQRLIQNYKDERMRLEAMLFADKDIATFLDMISDFAKSSNIRIVDMKAQKISVVKPQTEIVSDTAIMSNKETLGKKKKETGLGLTSIPIKIAIEGNFERTVEFLLSLEKYRQLLTLSNVNIRRGKYPLLNCNFTLRLYSLKQMEEIVK